MKVLFFASVRESLDTAGLELGGDCTVSSTSELRAYLIEQGGERWQQVLTQPNLICAVNQHVVHDEQALNSGDEVAFFPPVTGG